jgi:hypothetical protein
MPDERHGDDRHIVMADIEAAAKANGSSVQETWQNMQQAMAGAKTGAPAGQGGQRSGDGNR